MESQKYKSIVKRLLSLTGIEINGRNPWDIQIHDERFYKRVLTQVELGLGEKIYGISIQYGRIEADKKVCMDCAAK